MITVYHLEHSRSQRILWLLEELGVPYEVQRFARDPSGRAPQAYRALHPIGKSPLIRDGDLVLAESGAIVEYLLERHGGGRLQAPPGDPLRARYLHWFHFAEGTAMAFLMGEIVLGMAGDGAAPMRQVFEHEVRRILGYVASELGDDPWLAGTAFSAADVMMGYVLETVAERGELKQHPRLLDYVARMRERPAHRRAADADRALA
jgi:glutathione S-transferase